MDSIKNRDEALELIKKDCLIFKDLDEKYRDDAEIAMEAISRRIQRNIDLWITVESHEYETNFEYVSDRLKKDYNFVTKLLERYPESWDIFFDVDDSLFEKEEFMNFIKSNKTIEQSCVAYFTVLLLEEPNNKYEILKKYFNENFEIDETCDLSIQEILEQEKKEIANIEDSWENATQRNTIVVKSLKLAKNKVTRDEDYRILAKIISHYNPYGTIDDRRCYRIEELKEYLEQSWLENKTFWIGISKYEPEALEYISEKLKNDKEFMLDIVKNNGEALEYVSEELKNDKEIVLEAVKKGASALYYASEKLKNDKEVVLEAVKHAGYNLEYASKTLQNNKEVVLEAVKRDGLILAYASESLKNDKEVVLEAVKNTGEALIYASEELKNDKEIVLEAVKQYGDGENLQYASEELQNDKEVVLTAIREGDLRSIALVGLDVRNDKEVVLEAVQYEGYNLEHVSEAMQNDREVVLAAVKNNGDALEYASEELKNDKEILLEASKTGNHVFDHASKDFSNDREIVLRAVQTDYSLSFASEELRDDKEIVLEAVIEYGTNLKYASERLKKDKDIVLIAVLSSRGKAIEYVSKELQEEMELFILKGIEPTDEEIKYEIKKLRENYDLAYRLVIKDINNLRFFKDSKFYNKDFILLVLENAELMFDTNIIVNLKEELKEDEEIVLEVLRTYESEFVYLSDKLKNSKEFISKAIEINPYIRGYMKDYDFS